MNQLPHFDLSDAHRLWQAADGAGRAIPPAWPLQATVAVNPFLGQSQLTLAETAELLGRLSGTDLAPPRDWFARRIESGLITGDDLATALQRIPVPGLKAPAELAAAALREKTLPDVIPDVASLAARASGIDWPRIVIERIGTFAAGYFDEGQALWAASRAKGAYAAWRLFAMHDLTPEIAGLKGFAAEVAELPLSARDAIAAAGERLGLGHEPGTYFHQLLLGLGGYGQYARQLQFSAERDGSGETSVTELLAIRLAFEAALFRLYRQGIEAEWQHSLAAHRSPVRPGRDRLIDAALLEAAELGENRRRIASLEWACLSGKVVADPLPVRPSVQAAFCIDVRSEVFRRALETVDMGIATTGFAGFFGMGVAHRQAASDLTEHRLPVLLPAGQFTCEAVPGERDRADRFKARAVRAFGRFRQAAVSSFAFIEAMGPVYAGKLIGDSFRWRGRKRISPGPVTAHGTSETERTATAEAVLRAMSMTTNFARIVLLAGHGATSANNPFLSALQCGACGGHAGDVNARLLANLLNDPAVRAGLKEKNILIPEDTLFLAGLHDTTTDEVTLFEGDVEVSAHEADLARLRDWLHVAGRLARTERAKRLPRGAEAPPARRSRDWAETRPEWGLAGCTAFIAAPRSLTVGHSLEGRAFLHDYVWQKDEGFKVLELILTAPVVVASWINLQYYGSSVAPALFGSGNKLLHNVVGGIGVLEGNGGPMRTGLPWQSVHDGRRLVHEPMRLSVFVAAPASAVTDILARQPGLRQLLDRGWIKLFCINDQGGPTLRYAGDLRFEEQPAEPYGTPEWARETA
ncbi:YbcC family protein [Gellertiella hungarica]|uniref:Probable inorganic carbon transporter subunit DabA n=1 Tax=Gellertiella hungarica TaxID=1572859 RepID=A0A7W6NLG1_9HYPH|nr:DUF2309 domain-containing protein [Gellertiella hungarica]MBB4065380.1 hypothetical protein [Gellertiella hungarica]